MVRLEAEQIELFNRLKARFNSTLVRLEAVAADADISIETRFNSTLVRLEAADKKAGRPWRCVSIPLWFDWKLVNSTSISFSSSRFNSTLVRLEVKL